MFRQRALTLALALPPSALSAAALLPAVHAVLARSLLRWVPALHGVLLAWWDVRFCDPTRTAAVLWEFPEVHVRVALRALVFSPCVGMRVRGVVNHVGADYISLSVLATWKAHVHAPDIPEQAWRHAVEGAPRLSALNALTGPGKELEFVVKALQIDDANLSLVGSLDMDALAMPTPLRAATDKKRKRSVELAEKHRKKAKRGTEGDKAPRKAERRASKVHS